MNVNHFFTQEEKQKIVDAIKEAESKTSGEIRVHIDGNCNEDPLIKAKKLFHQLKMDKTELRNGILFYLAVKSKDFTVFGDEGIHSRVGQDFWNKITSTAVKRFKGNDFSGGLIDAICECGNQLKNHFPIQQNDINELNDEISFGN